MYKSAWAVSGILLWEVEHLSVQVAFRFMENMKVNAEVKLPAEPEGTGINAAFGVDYMFVTQQCQ